jgi:hypothetical protein
MKLQSRRSLSRLPLNAIESAPGGSGLLKETKMEHILQFFAYAHLPAHLQEVSRPFSEMAYRMVETLPRNPERTVALRKLLESKDASVRALVAKETASGQPKP